jgi:hypothetical protein
VDRLEEVEVELGLDVVTTLRAGRTAAPRAPAATTTEEVAEDPAEVTEILDTDVAAAGETSTREAPTTEAAGAHSRTHAGGDHVADFVVSLRLSASPARRAAEIS